MSKFTSRCSSAAGSAARIALVAAACGGGGHASSARAPGAAAALEAAIAGDLGARLGAPVAVRCLAPFDVPLACDAHLPDGSLVPIGVRDAGSAWTWSIDGRLVAAAPIEAYVRGVVADLGAPQGVTCGAALRRIAADERVACHLERGGAAFVAIGSAGELAVEVELDPAAAAARDEPVTRVEQTELDGLSRALAPGSDDE